MVVWKYVSLCLWTIDVRRFLSPVYLHWFIRISHSCFIHIDVRETPSLCISKIEFYLFPNFFRVAYEETLIFLWLVFLFYAFPWRSVLHIFLRFLKLNKPFLATSRETILHRTLWLEHHSNVLYSLYRYRRSQMPVSIWLIPASGCRGLLHPHKPTHPAWLKRRRRVALINTKAMKFIVYWMGDSSNEPALCTNDELSKS